MCVKYIVLVLLYILVNPEPTRTDETVVLEEFEQVLNDFIFQYHIDKFGTGNATDICEKPTKYINEVDFNKSELYKKFQLQKYLAKDSKCEHLCLNVSYEIVENDPDHVTPDVTTDETVVLEEFEQVLNDFIFQYHIDKFGTGNATDICEKPTKYINEVDFNKSELYKKFQLQKYLAKDSKCEHLCLNVSYEIVENDPDHVTPDVTTDETVVLEEFEQVLNDFIFQYHIDKFGTGNATDICEKPTKYINEVDFNKSELYKKFQLQKYLAKDSKCENLCLNVSYEIVKNDPDRVTPTISPVPDTASTGNAADGNQINETMTVGSGDENVESNNSKDTESARQTQEIKASGDKKTAIIVAATVMAVGTVSVAFIPVVNWVKTLLQSGTYVFPGSPNV